MIPSLECYHDTGVKIRNAQIETKKRNPDVNSVVFDTIHPFVFIDTIHVGFLFFVSLCVFQIISDFDLNFLGVVDTYMMNIHNFF